MADAVRAVTPSMQAWLDHVARCWHCASVGSRCPEGQRLHAEASPAPKLFSLVERRPAALTPVEVLEAFVADVKAGRVKPQGVVILWYEQLENGRLRPCSWHANMSYAELIAFLEVQKRMVIHDWIES